MEMTFGGPEGCGPQIEGKWTNTRTGQTIIVRDSFIEGNNMFVRTSTGALIGMNEFSRDYVQMSDEEYDAQGNVISQSSQSGTQPSTPTVDPFAGMGTPPQSPKEPKDDRPIEPEEFNQAGTLGPGYWEDSNRGVPAGTIGLGAPEGQSKSWMMLDTLFEKSKTQPKIDISINWTGFPTDELNMLIKFFDVTPDDIAEYLLNKFITHDTITDSINAGLTGIISKEPNKRSTNKNDKK